MNDASLRFNSVSFGYGSREIVKGFSSDIAEKEITSIIGPNGCGKSTLLKLANGFLKPHHGSITLNGKSVLDMTAKERSRRMGVLSQAPVAPAMTVLELVGCGRFPYLSAGGRLSPHDRKIVDEAISMVGLEDHRDQDVRLLSGGERQIAYLAMVIAQDTPLILLDEPTTFLDIQVCHRMMRIIQRLNKTMGKTFLMVIHDLDLALRYSDRLIVIDKDHSYQQGTLDSVLESKAVDSAFQIKLLRHVDEGNVTYSSIPLF